MESLRKPIAAELQPLIFSPKGYRHRFEFRINIKSSTSTRQFILDRTTDKSLDKVVNRKKCPEKLLRLRERSENEACPVAEIGDLGSTLSPTVLSSEAVDL